MSSRGLVTVSLLYVGVLVALSRRWLGDVRLFVQKAAGRVAPAAEPERSRSGGGDPRLVP